MKLEFNLNDITREDLVAAMADKLLTSYVHEEETNSTYPTHSPLAEQMRKLIDEKISAVAEDYVRNALDEAIKARIAAAVDDVIAEGWQMTNEYGEARGPKVDLKSRVTDLMLKATRDPYRSEPAMNAIDRQVKAVVETYVAKELTGELDKARKQLREQLDAVVSARFTDTLKKALGL